jgi:hypothetical protein
MCVGKGGKRGDASENRPAARRPSHALLDLQHPISALPALPQIRLGLCCPQCRTNPLFLVASTAAA